MLFGQLDFDAFGIVDGPKGAEDVLRRHLKTNLVVLGAHALHLVLVKDVGLGGG